MSFLGNKSPRKKYGTNFFTKIKNNIKVILFPKYQKAKILKNVLIKIYKDYEESTGINDIPYVERADLMIMKILKENKVDYYYDKLKKADKLN